MGIGRKIAGLARVIAGSDHDRYKLAERVAVALHPKAILGGYGQIWLDDEEYQQIFRRFRGVTSSEMSGRTYFLGQLAKSVSDLPGETAECGVYTGMGSHEICRFTQPGRTHHAFDSFEGVSRPDELDGTYWNEGDLAATKAEFLANVARFDVIAYEGWIPERFPEVADRKFCFVHIDVDLYQPTLDSLAFFYERMVPGGMIVCDDYGFTTCPGATKAFDEFMVTRPEPIVLAPTGQGIVIKR